MRPDKVFHLISNTHWDREWRFPFQRNRQMLVEMIDNVINILEKHPDYRAFHLDSQSIVVTDYLEIKPKNRDRITKLVNEKRLLIGPWYVLPDEFLVGGENLIRNLLIGHRICKDIGRVSKIGYSPFSWGQISQLPQLYNQFGIELIMFYRGVNSLDSHNAEFIWEGADGTRAVSSRFSTLPRYNFYFLIYRPVIHNETPYDVEYKWQSGGVPFHFADSSMYKEDYFMVEGHGKYFPENIKKSVEDIVSRQADDFTTPHVIWMEGHDSSGPNADTLKILEDIRRQFQNMNVIHSTLEDYADAVINSVNIEQLPLVKGERRSAQFDNRSGNLYGYTTSARMYLKQKNYEAEKWLQFYAEPVYNLTSLLGNDTDNNYLNLAWDYLVQNSGHDSIGGCSLDEIHEDMMWRYKQVIEISQGVLEKGLKYWIKNLDLKAFSSFTPAGIMLNFVNTLPYKRSGTSEIVIDIPSDLDKGDFDIIDVNGKKLPKEIRSVDETQPVLEQLTDRPMYFSMRRYFVTVQWKDLVPMGITAFAVKPKKLSAVKQLVSTKNRSKRVVIENNHLRVVINKNGTFDLLYKKTGYEYYSLGYLRDEGEAGHAWVNKPVDPIIDSLNGTAEIELEEKNSLTEKVKITLYLALPLNRVQMSPLFPKNTRKVKTPVEVLLTLNKNEDFLRIKLNVESRTINHRLRYVFPTELNVSAHSAEGQFDVVKRTTSRPDTSNWIEQPMYDFPAHHFVSLFNGENGLSVFSNGLKEYEVSDGPESELSFTLLRAFTYIIHPSSKEDYSYQPGSQCLGQQTFDFALCPHNKNWDEAGIYRKALEYSLPPSVVQSGISLNGFVSPNSSLVSINNENLIISCLKKSEDGTGYILRVYNPTEKTITGYIEFGLGIKNAQYSTLEEIRISRVDIENGNKISVKAGSKKIISIYFEKKDD
ncbi:MAG: hypothetical protein HUU54_02445 [Ignavibacteriaceae bacterium]|nr:hypothetical protein [Ignavibacteriaceae bacterium]